MTLYLACVLDNLREMCALLLIFSALGLFLLNIYNIVENDKLYKYTPYVLLVLILSALAIILIPPFDVMVKFI